jgi:L,D-transpeptidase catalytic domain
VGFSSCAMRPAHGGGLAAYHAYDCRAKLPKDLAAVHVKVSLSRQRAYVMEGEKMLMVMPVSVGKPDSPTPTGTFRISNKEQKFRAKTHGYAYRGKQVKKTNPGGKPPGWSFVGAPLPYWCGFKPTCGFHTGWVRHSPCTNDGCIRMHENLAPKFFRLVSKGTPVSISYSQPEDNKWSKIPLPPDAGPLPDYPTSMYIGDGYFSQHKSPTFD